jgi:hypothetical protein
MDFLDPMTQRQKRIFLLRHGASASSFRTTDKYHHSSGSWALYIRASYKIIRQKSNPLNLFSTHP